MSKVLIVLFLELFGKAGGGGDDFRSGFSRLRGTWSPADRCGCSRACRAAEGEVQVQLDLKAADAQAAELRAQEGDMRDVAVVVGMIGGDLRDDAVGGNDFENVQAFDDGGRDRDPSIMLLGAGSGNAGMALGEGDEPFDADGFGEAGEVTAAPVFQCDGGMLFDLLLDRTLQVSAENVGFGMVVMRV